MTLLDTAQEVQGALSEIVPVEKVMNSNTQEIMTGVMMAESEHTARGKLAQWVRLHILDGHYAIVGAAYGYLEAKHGKRSCTKGEYTASTPADSMRACIHNVTIALVGHESYHAEGALKPVQIGDKWGLEDKGAAKKSTVDKFTKFAKQFKTDSDKQDALEQFAKALGLELN